MPTLDDLDRLLGLVKKHEIDRLEWDGVVVVNSRHNVVTQVIAPAPHDDEDALYWSATQ